MRLHDGRKIKPNEIFIASEDLIPVSFRDLVQKLGKSVSQEDLEEPVSQKDLEESISEAPQKKGKFQRKNSLLTDSHESASTIENPDDEEV